MSQWRFFRVGLALFLAFSFSAGVVRASMRESASFTQDLWREFLALIPVATEPVSNVASDDATGDEGAGTDPDEDPADEGDEGDRGSEIDPNG
jgi:hypothetical protein